MEQKKKPKKWMKFRHKVVTELLRGILGTYSRWKYGIKVEKFKEQGNRQYLVVMNHQTAFDQFFLGMAFKGPIYYIASEDLFSNGFVSTLIRFLVAPIPIKKQTTDINAVMTAIRVAREGGTIALAPEGNRTFSGKTEYMNPAIGGLARKLKLPLAIFRIEGGYGVQPRWSDVVRKGKMRGYVSKVIEPEELAKMTNDQVCELIKQELDVNEAVADACFYHKKSAEYLDRAMYVCPDCGLSTFHSHNDIIECTKCGKQIRYLPTKELKGVNCEFPFPFVAPWYDYQCDYINSLDLTQFEAEPAYRDTVRLSEVIVYKRKILLSKAIQASLYGNRIVLDHGDVHMNFEFSKLQAVTVLGKNKINIYTGTQVFQLKGDKHFNALRYVNFFYRWTNMNTEDGHGKFLGL